MFHKKAMVLDCRAIDKKKDMGEYPCTLFFCK